ncbi:MAG TPA: prenyltransferase [Anaerolineales bacterium]|nr:prenyltransferase [Anaerolineales bacterium]
MKTWKPLLGTMRLPFVILAPACVLVGLGSAYLETGHINWFYSALALIAAVSAHISVNAFNEYFDYKTEVDARTQRTPFSGGSGTLQAHPELAKATLILSWTSLVITGVIGLYFLSVWGWKALPIGILGLFLLYGYTVWMVYQPALCLVAPGLGFGPLMVLSVHFALTGTFTWQAFIASLVPFFLVSNLLLLNQFPDVEADRFAGRRHFPILLGRTASGYIYIAFLIATYLVVVLGVLFGLLPRFSLLALLTIVFAVQIVRNVLTNSENVPALIPAMGQNVLVNLLTPVLLAIGLFIG